MASTQQNDSQSDSNTAVDVERGPAPAALKNEKDEYEIVLDELEEPTSLSTLRKWLCVLAISSACICVTCASSMGASTFSGIEATYHIGEEVAILSISLFVLGLSVGPLLLSPLSEFYGRRPIYICSYTAFFLFTFPVAFSNNIAVHLIFRFVCGASGSAFLSVAGGSISDIFKPQQVALPMALYSAAPFLGPVLGPVIAGFINQNTIWRWTYYVLIMWSFVELILVLLFCPETLRPILVLKKARSVRKSTGDDSYFAPVEKKDKDVVSALKNSLTTPFKIIIFEPMAFALNLWTSVLLGILYLFFESFPFVFRVKHGFSAQMSGLSFLGLGVGILIALALTPLWKKLHAREVAKEIAGPETRLHASMLGAILCPLSLFLFGFTSYSSVHWIVPIIMSIPFGTGVVCIFQSVFTYLVIAYQPVAASAMGANTFMRCAFAAGFPLFANQMFYKLDSSGASALLAGILTIMAPLPFVFYKYGASLRARSRFSSTK